MSTNPDSPKVALVTGASGGIGGAVARRLARPDCSLLLAYHENGEAAERVAKDCRDRGSVVELVSCDLSQMGQATELIGACVARYSRLTFLVHCAGVAQESLLATLDDATLLGLVNLHVLSTVALTRAALRPMLQERMGRIVLLSSVAAQKPSQGASVYAGCKGFIESFVRAMAVEVGRKGVTVNAVAPGLVETPMTRSVRELVGPELVNRCALRRQAHPDEIGAAVAFLCGSDAAYVNGHILAIDGAYLGPP